ncbi:hypothetical protein TDB9533_03994 [Thalassocella blandensis]|nr:hypothetical protein TDB9533_03994 [Thalassocella blandensis]
MKTLPMVVVAGIVLAAAGYFFFAKQNATEQVASSPADSTLSGSPQDRSAMNVPGAVASKSNPSDAAELLSEDEALIERMEVMRERRPNMDFDPEAVALAMQRESAWTPVKEKPTNLPLEPELLNDGRKFFRLDDLKLETLVPGDTVKVNLEEVNEEYEVVIDRTEKHDYDSLSWYGHIETGDGQTYRVNFTKGGNLTVGGLSTPEGHFVIQSHGQTGWIASSATLFKIDPNQPDVMYPPGHEPDGEQHQHSHDETTPNTTDGATDIVPPTSEE